MSRHNPISDLADALRGLATHDIEMELVDLETVFALLVMGSVTGMSLPPSPVSMRLVGHMESEMASLLGRTRDLDDMLVMLAGRWLG